MILSTPGCTAQERAAKLYFSTHTAKTHLANLYRKLDLARPPPKREDLINLSRQFQGNVAQKAAHFGKDRKQVYRWVQKHDVDPSDYC